jgi:hypothetical protein
MGPEDYDYSYDLDGANYDATDEFGDDLDIPSGISEDQLKSTSELIRDKAKDIAESLDDADIDIRVPVPSPKDVPIHTDPSDGRADSIMDAVRQNQEQIEYLMRMMTQYHSEKERAIAAQKIKLLQKQNEALTMTAWADRTSGGILVNAARKVMRAVRYVVSPAYRVTHAAQYNIAEKRMQLKQHQKLSEDHVVDEAQKRYFAVREQEIEQYKQRYQDNLTNDINQDSEELKQQREELKEQKKAGKDVPLSNLNDEIGKIQHEEYQTPDRSDHEIEHEL